MSRYAPALLLTLALLLCQVPKSARGQDATPATTTMAPGVLIDTTVDRAQLPGEEGIVIFGRQTFQPGAKRTYDAPDLFGTEAVVVESGELTFTIEGGDGRIFRGATTATPSEEPALAGTPFTLAAGDALVYPAHKHIEMNEGDEPAVTYFVAVLEPIAPPEPDPSDVGEEMTEFLGQSAGAWPDLPPGPVRLTVRMESLEAGGMLPAPAGGMQTIGQLSGGSDSLVVASNGALNLGQESVDVFAVALAPESTAAATPRPQASPASSPVRAPGDVAPAEELLAVTLPAAALPDGPAYVELWRSTWAPGDKAEFPDWHPAVSVQVEVVFAGEYGARSKGEIIAWRDGASENVPLGEEVVLGAGDAAIYLDNAADQEVRNAGSTPAEIATFVVSLADDYQGPNLGIDWERAGLSGRDVALTIARQTLAPGEALPADSPSVTNPVLCIVEEGALEWMLVRADGQHAAPALRFDQGAVVPFAIPPAGELVALRNAGTEPLKLLTVSMTAASTTATPAAGTPAA
jgi:hypothetical protein